MTDKKTESTVEKTVENKAKPVVKASDAKFKKSTSVEPKIKRSVSKLALIALIFALLSFIAIVFFAFVFNEQKQAFQQELQSIVNNDTNKRLAAEKIATKRLLAQQQALFEARFGDLNQLNKHESQKVIDELQRTVDQLSATKPSDWLIHEAQYLVRVAVRTLWLEKNTKAAIGLLTDADSRLKE